MGLLLAIPFLLLLLLFALSNREMVRVALWPTDWSVDVMLSVAVLGAAAVAFLVGALTVWLAELGRRRRLRRAEQKISLLEDQLRTLRSRTAQPPMTPLT
jgi:putative membrane protein